MWRRKLPRRNERLAGKLFLWKQAVHLIDPPAVRQFIDTVKPQQPVLIVFDTLSRCSLGADENIQKDMNFILEALDTIRRETGGTVVAVHHTNVAGTRERGPNVIRGGMDVMIEVAKEDDHLVVSYAKVKDANEFDPIFLKPVLVDIGEENPVPVLVPAEKRTQTPADKLTPLQLAILRAVGMEMFAESGIKSSQLDALLPPDTKRASKYHSLNTLIRLGYVRPHVKGDPYWITGEGRLKLSSAENGGQVQQVQCELRSLHLDTAGAKSNVQSNSTHFRVWIGHDIGPDRSRADYKQRIIGGTTIQHWHTTVVARPNRVDWTGNDD